MAFWTQRRLWRNCSLDLRLWTCRCWMTFCRMKHTAVTWQPTRISILVKDVHSSWCWVCCWWDSTTTNKTQELLLMRLNNAQQYPIMLGHVLSITDRQIPASAFCCQEDQREARKWDEFGLHMSSCKKRSCLMTIGHLLELCYVRCCALPNVLGSTVITDTVWYCSDITYICIYHYLIHSQIFH